MTELVITRGLPAAGKTTWARQWVADATRRVRVNRDDLRYNLFGLYWGLTHRQEDEVTAAQRAAVRALLEQDVSVVVDDTNLRLAHAKEWAKLAGELGADFEVVDFPVDPGECVERDSDRRVRGERSVGDTVIWNLADRYGLRKRWLDPVEVPRAGWSTTRDNPVDLGYFAGILDGEGSIVWNTNQLRLRVPNTNKPMLDLLVRKWGGSLSTDNSQRKDGLNRKPKWLWTLSGNAAVELLQKVLPFLVVKADRAREMIVKWDESAKTNLKRKSSDELLLTPAGPPARVYSPDGSLPTCWLVDLDGTLAHMTERGPFEWERVGEDDLDLRILGVVEDLAAAGNDIVVLSGRDAVCRTETEGWLRRNGIPYADLLMRPAGDTRKDAVVKEELFWEHVANGWHVLGVLDDRPSVCRMWRSIGLLVLQVGDPHVEF